MNKDTLLMQGSCEIFKESLSVYKMAAEMQRIKPHGVQTASSKVFQVQENTPLLSTLISCGLAALQPANSVVMC